MFSQAPIVAAARGCGLLNIVSSFNASVRISVILFCNERTTNVHLLNKKKKKKIHIILQNVSVKSLHTKIAKAKARGNALANIIIMPNCNANSKRSAGRF